MKIATKESVDQVAEWLRTTLMQELDKGNEIHAELRRPNMIDVDRMTEDSLWDSRKLSPFVSAVFQFIPSKETSNVEVGT